MSLNHFKVKFLKKLKHVSRSNLEEKDHQWILTITDEEDRVWKKLEKTFAYRKMRVLEKNEDTKIYYIIDTYPTQGKVTIKSPIYQVHLRLGPEQNTEIYLTDNDGHIPNAAIAQRLLNEIQEGLHGSKVHTMPALIKKILTEQEE